MPKVIDIWIKKQIYHDYKKNNVNMNDIVKKYGVNKRTVYMICKKLSNDEEIRNLKTSSSENDNKSEHDNKWDNNEIQLEKIEEINWNEILLTPNINETNNNGLKKEEDVIIANENNDNWNDAWSDKEEEEEKNELSNTELINFLKQSDKIDLPIIKDETEPKIIKNPLQIKRVSFCEDFNPDILPEKNESIINIDETNNKKWIKKPYNKKNILNENDIEIITNNNVDLWNNEKNNLIIKIRKYYIYFEY